MKITFKNRRFDVFFAQYGNGRTAMRLIRNEEDYVTATINLADDAPLPANHVFIKDWSENHGILQVLIAAGVLRDTGVRVPTGYVEAAVCELLVDPSLQEFRHAPRDR